MLDQGALSGITVLDLSRLLPGPYCSMILADHGARVIAVEDRRFQADDFFLDTVYRNKEHMSLNLKSEAGRSIFFQLVDMADVVIEGFRPGVVERLGVDYPSVSRAKPSIVYCSITGYGQTGPYRDRAGHDVNYLAASGVLDLIGEPDRPPSIPGVQIADLVGGLNGVAGILMALRARDVSGQGQHIDISMTDAVLSLLPLVQHFRTRTGREPRRGFDLLSHRYAFYTTYETRDKRFIAMGALENRFWQQVCEHLGCPEYGPLQYDESRRQEIIDHFRDLFAQKTLSEWELDLAGLDACVEPIRTVQEAMAHPLFQDRETVQRLPDDQSDTCLGVWVKMSETPGQVRTPPSRFGQDTARILGELGYTDEDIGRMEAEGTV